MQIKQFSIFISLGGLLLTPIIVMHLIKPVAKTDNDGARTPQSTTKQIDGGLDTQKAKEVQRDLAKAQQEDQKRLDKMQKDTE